MIEALLISNVVSWVAIVALGVLVIALSRQIGVLHERLRPVGALSMGQALKVGDEAPFFKEPGLNGGMVRIGGAANDDKLTLLFFLSSDCPVCKTLLPVVVAIAQQEKAWLRVVFASDGNTQDHEPLIKSFGLEDFDYVLSTEVGMSYQVAKLPYSYLLDTEGEVAAHGLINNREHLESLFEAHNLSSTTAIDLSNKEDVHAGQVAG